MVTVQVLLSTYNGAQYISEQLDSLLRQESADLGVDILIRDDGSTDHTSRIISEYVKNFPDKIRLIKGHNEGVVGSFFDLIKESSENHDFLAFCDQDDVWKGSKLSRAVSLLNKRVQNTPLMYCSATSMVDEELNFIRNWPTSLNRPATVYNALIENIAVGCTLVVNRKAMELIKTSPPKTISNLVMHDWWIYLCISAFGDVVFDSEAHILYRQHQSNVIGGQTENLWLKWYHRLLRFIKGKNQGIIRKQATEFIQTFGHLLTPTHSKDIERFLSIQHKNIGYRFLYVIKTPFYRQAWIDSLVFKIAFLMGRI